MMRIDICMWAKNGERFLPIVLPRIEEVIPSENINQKIFVDDHSIDNTVEIAKDFNWSIYENKLGFVSGGVHEALRHVKSEFFASFEQDVILAKNWWDKIPSHVCNNERVALAQGVRLPTLKSLRCILAYSNEKHPEILKQGFSIDNNFYRTKIIKRIDIPMECPISVDLNLRDRLRKHGYKWIVDSSVVSNHIRLSLIYQLRHSKKLFLLAKRKQALQCDSLKSHFARLLFSPIRGLEITIKKNCPEAFFVYPILKLNTLLMKAMKPR